MASLQIEVASSSSPFGYSNIRDHNRSSNIKKGYIHSHSRINEDDDSSWLPVQDSKPTTDDSWLPTVASESDVSNHQKGQNKDADDSWLPTSNDANNKYLKNNHESDNDFDYSCNNNSGIQKKPKNDHWALAREVVFSCEQKIQNADLLEKSSDSSKRHNSPKERSTVESPSSGGVSSLLQRWRDLAEAKNSNKNDNSSPPSNRSNSESTCKENKNNKSSNSPPLRDGFAKNNNNNPSQCPPRGSNASDGVTVEKSKDSDTDWESDKTNRSRRLSCPLPSRDSKDSNNVDAEKEKIRVVDIIKKLSREEELAASSLIGGDGNESLPPIRTSRVKVSGHLIRGRHAFKVFLMRTEHDKIQELKWLVERKVVSKFPHRSRLQSMLRIRMLRLGAEPKPGVKGHKRCVSKTLESNNRLDIMDLREKFNSRVDKGETDSEKHKRNVMKNSPDEEIYITSNPTKQVDIKSKAMTKIKTKTTTINTNIHSKKQETQQKLEPMTTKSTSSCKNHHVMHKAKDVDTYSNSNMGKEDMIRYKDDDKDIFQEDEGQFMSAKTSYTHMEEKGISDSENDASMKQGLESYENWTISENSQTRSDFDEDESCEMQFDTTHDWISDISRPKSDWEDMRQARYQEMLDPFSGHIDIRRLLERKNVSSFLASSLREKIDQLMMSRIQQSNVQVGKQVVVREKSELRKEVMAIEGKEYEREQNCSMVDEDGRMERQCCEYSGFVPPYLERSWRPNIDINSSSDPTTSPSLEQSISSNRSHNNGTPQSSSVTPRHPSIELELIYDLRGHMERLHQEITELRKSINSCVTMQIKMQHSFKQNLEVAATTLQNKEGKPPSLGKNDCCICNDMQVDSLLYRCGHMCACFKCALELQCTSGECPICEAPIMDVVKAFGRDN
ncbi:uncharacterized protein LOC112502727 [Cynara cardunculus var. scolymus]|uniref:uncharacterized protein LOC112502727 n=1 Tax=Cynara cardunculus var. scolymus TaxID=59895 RepID=UPI000D625CFE|nr:uncharacterized protein LOC112502727 [Cynara cardunculus var. scolymus]